MGRTVARALEVLDEAADGDKYTPTMAQTMQDCIGKAYGIVPWIKFMATAIGFGIFLLPKYVAPLGWSFGLLYLWAVGGLMYCLPSVLEVAMAYVQELRDLDRHAWTVVVTAEGGSSAKVPNQHELLRMVGLSAAPGKDEAPMPKELALYVKLTSFFLNCVPTCRRNAASTTSICFPSASKKDEFLDQLSRHSPHVMPSHLGAPSMADPELVHARADAVLAAEGDNSILRNLRVSVRKLLPEVEVDDEDPEADGAGDDGEELEHAPEMADALRPVGGWMVLTFRIFSILLFFFEYLMFIPLIEDCGLLDLVGSRFDGENKTELLGHFEEHELFDNKGQIMIQTDRLPAKHRKANGTYTLTLEAATSGGFTMVDMEPAGSFTKTKHAIKKYFVVVVMAALQVVYFAWLQYKGKIDHWFFHWKGNVQKGFKKSGFCDDLSAYAAFAGCIFLGIGLFTLANRTEEDMLNKDLEWSSKAGEGRAPGAFPSKGPIDTLGSLYQFFTLFTVAGLVIPVRGQVLHKMERRREGSHVGQRAGEVNKCSFHAMLVVVLGFYSMVIYKGHNTWGRGMNRNVIAIIMGTREGDGGALMGDSTMGKVLSIGAGINLIFSGVLLNAETFKEVRHIVKSLFKRGVCIWDSCFVFVTTAATTVGPVLVSAYVPYAEAEKWAFLVCAITLPCLQGLFVLVAVMCNALELNKRYGATIRFTKFQRIAFLYMLVLCLFAIVFGMKSAISGFWVEDEPHTSEMAIIPAKAYNLPA